MTSKKLYFVLIAAVVLATLGLFAVGYGANVLLQSEAKKLAAAKANSAALETQKIELAKNKSDITKYSELSKIAEAVVPQDKDQAQAVREIVNIANQSGIRQLSSITFPTSTLGTKLPGAAAAGGGLTQVTPVKGIQGVYGLQLTVTLDAANQVPYNTFIAFLSKLEQNRRTAQVSSVTVTPDTRNPNMVSFTLIIDEYIKP